MRNAIFPSLSSPFYSLGNNEVQMPSSNASSMELERLNSYSSGFFHDSQVSNDLQLGRFSPLSTVEVSQPLDYLTGADALMTNSMYENASPPKFLDRFDSLENVEDCMENGTKRTFASDAMADETTTKESKRRKPAEDQVHHQPSKEESATQKLRVPARRSNKLGERVTALQQLVSPFGKTDTASVLQEATVHIKLLQEQIQILSTPYFRIRPSLQSQNGGEEKTDLSSRGLCLVPVSSTLNLTKGEDSINRYSSTGRPITTRF